MRSVVAFMLGVGGLGLLALADPPLRSADPPLRRGASPRLSSDDPRLGEAPPPATPSMSHPFPTRTFTGVVGPLPHFLGHGFHHGFCIGVCPPILDGRIGVRTFPDRFARPGCWWWGGYGWLGTYNGPYLVGVDSPISAYLNGAGATAREEPAPEPPPCDPAADPACALSQGNYAQALTLLTAGSETLPVDPAQRRLAALALLGLNRFDDAVDALAEAYSADPALANSPLDLLSLLGDSENRLFSLAVRRAHRSPSPDAWLLVAVLMQGQGRDDAALRMLERPEAEGVESTVVAAMSSALAPGRPSAP